ncbi:chaperone NapD [Shewanella gelidii]|uniref:Chaperone NapD n=1 Tax=Shewanella gelidii TaxID=1642821 RepID=A0A917JPB6_9GAMM|nr:chaperone NapD [Shewanella gelidii]MCL1097868.1 chaperone NapD [Shewanella gelidii]GGI78093.1 sorbose reductase [Shewanella gelidii]
MTQEYHVSSLVVLVTPEAMSEVSSEIRALPGTEIHAVTEEGKVIVTLEGETQKAILSNVEKINALKGVLSNSLIYHQVEPLEQESEETP